MTEIKKSTYGNEESLGLYATQSYKAGDVILEESCLLNNHDEFESEFIDLSFWNNEEKTKSIFQSYYGNKSFDITNPLSNCIRKWKGMIQIATSYALIYDQMEKECRQSLLSLYYPTNDKNNPSEKIMFQIANAALNYCRKQSKPNSKLHQYLESSNNDLNQIMLIWAYNSFEGGLLYKYACRINHSCDPNCIVNPSSSSNQQKIIAITTILPGDELFISYLGIVTWLGGYARQNQLLRDKSFICSCKRCMNEDKASGIPCPSCHPRQGPGNKYLDESIQWDDDEQLIVYYAYPKNAKCDTLSYRTSKCQTTIQYNSSPILKIGKKVMDKVLLHIDTLSSKNSSIPGIGPAELVSINTEMDEQLYQLSSSVLGANHWATNIMLLSLLDRMLASFNAIILLGQDLPDMSELAEAIDSLQRLWKYTSHLHLNMDSSFLLHSQTIGIARALVALGDVKSMKYGSEWIEKIHDFITMYESQDMQNVIHTLKNAYKKPSENNQTNDMDVDQDNSKRSSKRSKQ